MCVEVHLYYYCVVFGSDCTELVARGKGLGRQGAVAVTAGTETKSGICIFRCNANGSVARKD